MAGLANKLIIGALSSGAIGGTAYLVSVLTDTTDTVENYFKKKGLKFVPKSNTNFWKKSLETFVFEDDEELKLGGGDDDFFQEEDIQKWCDENSKTKIKSTDSKEFKIASRICFEFKTIEEALGKNNFEENTKNLAVKYKNLPQDIKVAVDKLTVLNESNEEGDKVKRWCNDNKKRRMSDENNTFEEQIKKTCLKD